MITQRDLNYIWMEGEPFASQSFERLASDHGRRFAEDTRDHILACKRIEMNMEAIQGKCPRPLNGNRKSSACIDAGTCGCILGTVLVPEEK